MTAGGFFGLAQLRLNSCLLFVGGWHGSGERDGLINKRDIFFIMRNPRLKGGGKMGSTLKRAERLSRNSIGGGGGAGGGERGNSCLFVIFFTASSRPKTQKAKKKYTQDENKLFG